MSDASDPDVELLLRSRLATAPIVWDATTLAVDRLPPQFVGVHSRPAVALEDVSASLGQDHQRPIITAGRNGVDQPGVLEVPQIAPVRVERTVVAIAEIAGRDDAEGADGGERANLPAAQPDVAVACPDTLAFRPCGSWRSRVNTSRASSCSRSRGLLSPPRLPRSSSRSRSS
jgi:hypothetical protein